MTEIFTDALKKALHEGSLEKLRAIPKSDLHNHAGRGGSLTRFCRENRLNIEPPPPRFASLDDMDAWFLTVKKALPGFAGLVKRWEASFAQASRDNIAVLAMSFSTRDIDSAGSIENFIDAVNKAHQKDAPQTAFFPELSYDRTCDVPAELERLEEILSRRWFRSLDICNHEFAQPIANFKPMYRAAKSRGLRLKAHVGEIGKADDVWAAVETLELDEVHHGIAAASSEYVIKKLAAHRIRMNVSPASNIALGLSASYKTHPIKTLYHAGIPVTINSDDMMIFNQSVSCEYLNLFKNGVFTAEELEEILQIGLDAMNIYTQSAVR